MIAAWRCRPPGRFWLTSRETQKTSLGHITRLIPYRRADTLALDEMTRRSLELVRTLREGKREGSLLSVIDCSATPMGARLLSEWLTSPLTSTELITERLEAVEELFNQSALRGDLRSLLGQSYDLERLAGRIGTGRATPRDLVALAKTLGILPKLKARLTARVSKRLNQLEGALELCPEIRAEIEAALWDDPPLAVKEGGLIRDGYHAGLDELRANAKGGKSWIAKFQAEQVRRTGIASLKVGFNKVFGYYIEITHAQAQARGARIPEDYIRKQTVKNAERYITAELKEHEEKVLRAEDRAHELEYELFTTLRDRVSAEAPRLDSGRRGPGPARRAFVAGRAGRPARLLSPRDRRRAGLRGRSGPPSRARRDPRPRRFRPQRHRARRRQGLDPR